MIFSVRESEQGHLYQSRNNVSKNGAFESVNVWGRGGDDLRSGLQYVTIEGQYRDLTLGEIQDWEDGLLRLMRLAQANMLKTL